MALEQEFEHYLAHREELAAKHAGKVLAIKGQGLLGVFDSEREAIMALSSDHSMGSYLLQRCTAGEEGHTRVFHSRVVFV